VNCELAFNPTREEALRAAARGRKERSLIVFADDWGRHPSSCQHLVRRLANDWRILWVNTIGTRQVRVDGFTFRRGIEKIQSWRRALRQVSDQMWVLSPPMLPASGGAAGKRINRWLVTQRIRSTVRRLEFSQPLVLTTLPYTAWLLGDVGQRGLVYYCTDDYSFWPGADREMLQAAEREISRRADLVLAASHKLADLHAGAARCEYFPHAVDFDHFASAASVTSLPEPLRKLPAPRIGFFGLIYEKLDFHLLRLLAESLPQASLVFIGPVDYCPEDFTRLPNVHFVGKQPYEELPSWIAGLDVLLMPYVNDEMIRQSNPLKLRECLATGKPTISIDIPEVRCLQPHVQIARTPGEYLEAVRRAIGEPESASVVAARQQAVEHDSWDRRAARLQEVLTALETSSSKQA
jgi:glycosyltransferase involved in cell wall biosynthesis